MTNRFAVLTLLIAAAFGWTLAGCERVKVPESAVPAGRTALIWPDYAEVTIPLNLAPMNFLVREKGDSFVTEVRGSIGPTSGVFGGKTVLLPEAFWKSLLEENAGGEISFTAYARRDGKWSVYEPFSCSVSEDRIDRFVAYRLIEPGYENYRHVTLRRRSLESYDEKVFVDNAATDKNTCVNCHSFQNRKTENFLFHARRKYGGTILVRGGRPTKLDTKSPTLNLPAVYPSWHPTLPLVAFSSNKTKQVFHSIDRNRIDVLDFYSDLVLYDVDANRFTPFPETRNVFETFPSWSFDGRTLFYCAATLEPGAEVDALPLAKLLEDFPHKKLYDDFRYNIMKMPFDETTRTFGPAETVVDAAAEGKTALHPRLSLDGRYLVYTRADFGTFPIWHRESDLWLLDMQTGERRPLDELNSTDVESWHTWDSSGHWLVFSSRRDDGSYTRLYFAHFNGDGTFDKPFLLPQKDPNENLARMKSYNVPEFITEEIPVSAGRLGAAVRYGKEVRSSYGPANEPSTP